MDKIRLSEKMQDFFTRTRKRLLVFLENAELRALAEQHLQAVCPRLDICQSQQAALQKIRTNSPSQILLEDCSASQVILDEIAAWPGRARRFTHVVLLGERGTSLDSQLAFTLGVDSYLHVQDIKRLGKLFEQSQKIFLYRNRLWIQEDHDL